MTYKDILNQLPQSVKDRYQIDHHEALDCLMITADGLGFRFTTTSPINDIYEIEVGESYVRLRGAKSFLTLFIDISMIHNIIF